MLNQIRHKRYFKQTLSFGIIWFVFGITYAVLEYGLIGSLTEYPTTGNEYDFKHSLLVISIASFIMGLIQGSIEILWLKNYFKQSPFLEKNLI